VAADAAGRVPSILDGLRDAALRACGEAYRRRRRDQRPVDAPGDVFPRRHGASALIDADNNVPMVGAKILAYEKLFDGTRAPLSCRA
jgi:hypothetical protein